MNSKLQPRFLAAFTALAFAALLAPGAARAQNEGFGGAASGAGAPPASTEPEGAEAAPDEVGGLDDEVVEDATGDEAVEADADAPPPAAPREAPLFPDLEGASPGPPPKPRGQPEAPAAGSAPRKVDDPGTSPAPPSATSRPRERFYEPVTPESDNPPPDGIGNLAGTAVQYGTGFCSSCGCCGASGVVGGVALAAGIVIPGGSLLFGPVVGCLGCVSIAGAPAVGVSAGLWLREWLGIWRGPWAWAVMAAYAVEMISVAIIGAGAIAAAFLLSSFGTSIVDTTNFTVNPDPATWAWESAGLGAGIFLATFGLGLVSAIVFPAGAGTLTYQLMGEQKNHWDIGFRVPGVFGPNHAPEPIVHPPDKKGPERSRVRKDVAEPAAMHY